MSVARFIADQRTNYRVPHTVVCVLLGASLAWFYKWLGRAQDTGCGQRSAHASRPAPRHRGPGRQIYRQLNAANIPAAAA